MRMHTGNGEAPFKRGVWRSIKGVTVAEFAIVVAVLVIASGAIGSSRFRPVKDDFCYHPRIGCTTAHARLATGNDATRAPEKDRHAVAGAKRAQRQDQRLAERRAVAQLDGSEGRKTTSPLTGSPGSTDR